MKAAVTALFDILFPKKWPAYVGLV